MASMKKEEARRTVLSEYDKWAKKHPNKASMMGGFLFFRYLQDEKVRPSRFSCGLRREVVHGWLRDRLEISAAPNTRAPCQPTNEHVLPLWPPGLCAVISYALSGEKKKAREAGCDDYVPKPFSPRQLLAKIRQYLS
jgi:hypothetical protein